MTIKQAAAIAETTLSSLDIPVAFDVKGGTWTTPGSIEFEAKGKKHRLEAWEDAPVKRMAAGIFQDVLREIDPDRLDYLKADGFELAQ